MRRLQEGLESELTAKQRDLDVKTEMLKNAQNEARRLHSIQSKLDHSLRLMTSHWVHLMLFYAGAKGVFVRLKVQAKINLTYLEKFMSSLNN